MSRFLRIPAGVVSLAVLSALVLLVVGRGPATAADDWPQFRGPQRDGKCTETGLLAQWAEGQPKLLWKLAGLGRGYSTVAIADGRILTMGDRQLQGEKSQVVMAFDLATRKELWATWVGPPHSDGSRCTPTVDGALTYAVGTDGDLVCVETATGKLVWNKNFKKDFGGFMMSVWKFSESPLVDGNKLICTPGGPEATLVALDKKTGETIWKCAVPKLGGKGKDGAGYSSMVVAEIEGVRQVVQIFGRGVVGVAVDSGKFLWGYNDIANGVANITTPVVHGNHVFVSTAYGTGSALLKIVREGDGFKAEKVYFLDAKTFTNHHGGVILVGDCIYGGHGQNNGDPTCIDFLTGKIVWQQKAIGKGSAAVLYADGNLIFRYQQTGLVALVEATPKGLHVKGRFEPAANDGPAWAYPVIHDGRLYLRSHDTLMCYDLRAAAQ